MAKMTKHSRLVVSQHREIIMALKKSFIQNQWTSLKSRQLNLKFQKMMKIKVFRKWLIRLSRAVKSFNITQEI